MDKQGRAKLLGEIHDERLGDEEDKARWALYEMRAKQKGCKYVPGSLCELEMIQRCFKGKKSVSVHVLNDDRSVSKLDDEKVAGAGSNTGQLLDGAQFLIEEWEFAPPKHGRNVRSVLAWINSQFYIMRGCSKPWLKKYRNDPTLPDLCLQEFINRYFFAGMEWDSRLIQNTYFNMETRKVFFQFTGRGDLRTPPPTAPK